MTKECKETMRDCMMYFFEVYDCFCNGTYDFERNDRTFKAALLEAANVMMMDILERRQELAE